MPDRGRVLLVDDDASSRTALAWLLEDAGFEVIEAASASEAREKMAADLALAIIDVHLGDDIGTDLIPELRERAPKARVAVVSGAAGAEHAAGAELMLTKAADPAEAIEKLVALLDAPA